MPFDNIGKNQHFYILLWHKPRNWFKKNWVYHLKSEYAVSLDVDKSLCCCFVHWLHSCHKNIWANICYTSHETPDMQKLKI